MTKKIMYITSNANAQTLHMVFGVLGLLVGSSMLKYCLKKHIEKGAWVPEHIGSMIGSAIGAYTAFIAFGGRTLLADAGQWQILFWIAPGVIGGIASALLCKKYSTLTT